MCDPAELMDKAMFYVRAGFPEITSGEIETSVKEFPSHQRAWLTELRVV